MAEIREPQKANAIEKKNKIIEAGLRAFGEKGYYKTTTVEIAMLAGVSTGIVYSYFKDKKDILLHALRLYFANVFRPMEETLKTMTGSVDIEAEARSLIQIAIQSHRENLAAHEEMIAMSHLDKDVHSRFMELEHEITETVSSYLEAGGVRPPYLKEKTHIAYNLIETLCHEAVYHRHPYIDYTEMIEQTVRLLVFLFSE